MKTQFNENVQVIRSVNAKELCEGAILRVYNKIRIEHQRSCVDSPQQNRVVERKHRHLLDVARSLYFQSIVLVRFWGDCLLTTIYLINRVPLIVLKTRLPMRSYLEKCLEWII